MWFERSTGNSSTILQATGCPSCGPKCAQTVCVCAHATLATVFGNNSQGGGAPQVNKARYLAGISQSMGGMRLHPNHVSEQQKWTKRGAQLHLRPLTRGTSSRAVADKVVHTSGALVCQWLYARKPSFSPFFFANRISPCTCLPSAPSCLQKSLMTWECREMAFPLSWLKGFTPITFRTTTTIGAKGPVVAWLPA